MSQKDMDDIKKAIAAIDAKKKGIRASFVRGGATGLRQQRNIKNYPPSRKGESMKQDIKNQCCMLGEEMVLMQFGSTFDIVDENAEYFHKNFEFKYNSGTVNFFSTGFALSAINKYKKKLIKKRIKFCIVEEVSKEKGKPIIRKVTYSSSNGPSLGKEFIGGIKE
jgi:hypothetical protein